MKIFKWHLISDLDLYLEQRYSMKIFKSRIKQLEEDNYKQYKSIDIMKNIQRFGRFELICRISARQGTL